MCWHTSEAHCAMCSWWLAPDFISLDQTIKGNPVSLSLWKGGGGSSEWRRFVSFPALLSATRPVRDSARVTAVQEWGNNASSRAEQEWLSRSLVFLCPFHTNGTGRYFFKPNEWAFKMAPSSPHSTASSPELMFICRSPGLSVTGRRGLW